MRKGLALLAAGVLAGCANAVNTGPLGNGGGTGEVDAPVCPGGVLSYGLQDFRNTGPGTAIRVGRPAATAAAVGGMLVIALLATACGTRTAGHGYIARARAGAVTVPLTGGGRFAPAPARSRPALTPNQAWARYVKVNTSYHGSAIPRGVSVQLGLLTLPIGRAGPHGAEVYLAHNELVYGYRWHQCPQSQGPPGSTLPPNPCIAWNFLSASTGGQIVETWQVYR